LGFPSMPAAALSFVESGLSALERALHDRGSDFRNVQIATVSPEGNPSLRTLVLRGFGRSPACAEMHTDARAGKARDIAQASRVALLSWSSADHLQLRFEGSARLHHGDAVARSRWDTLSSKARDTYGLRAEPGASIPDPDDRTHLPPDEQFRQFAVILVSLASVDILRLDPDGAQTRARGQFTPSGLSAHWIAP